MPVMLCLYTDEQLVYTVYDGYETLQLDELKPLATFAGALGYARPVTVRLNNAGAEYSINTEQGHKLAWGQSLLLEPQLKLAAVAHNIQCLQEQAVLLPEGVELTIGRSRQNDIVLPTTEVSGRHAVIKLEEGSCTLTDCGSTNHTYVNGRRIAMQTLRDKDTLYLAGWMLTYESGMLQFVHTPKQPTFSLKASLRKNDVAEKRAAKEYPVFSRSPRVQVAPLDEKIEFLSPQSKQLPPDISWFDSLAPSALAALTGIGLIYAIPNTIITVKNMTKRKRKFKQQDLDRLKQYEKYLAQLELFLEQKHANEKKRLHEVNPGLAECVSIARQHSRRLWERSLFDTDYLSVRVGLGSAPSGIEIRLPRDTIGDTDELLEKPREFHERYTTIEGIPSQLDLKGSVTVGLYGMRASVVNCSCAILANVAVHHPYNEVKVVCLYNDSERTSWEWARWLPHVWDDDRGVRFLATNRTEAGELLRYFDEVLRERQRTLDEESSYNATVQLPYLVFVVADNTLLEDQLIARKLLNPNPNLGVIVLFAYEQISDLPNTCHTLIECQKDTTTIYKRDDYANKRACVPDVSGPADLEALARALAPIRLKKMAEDALLPACVTFLQGYGVKQCEELDVLRRWKRSKPYEAISAPLGMGSGGKLFDFDLHEKALGPHGLVAGTTGFGKSELLQTWLLSMALNYRPDDLSFILIDFKGEGFAGFLKKLPHVAGIISNIEISAIKRNLTALTQELNRRQDVFKTHQIKDIYKYQRAYAEGKIAEPMSHLVIVIDEFAQLKKDYPEYMDIFVSVARVGRSLGVHLVLATQSPGGVVDNQVLSNTRFKIVLKTANASESRDILGNTDAASITVKGRAVIQVGQDEVYEHIQTFWSGAEYHPGKDYVKSNAKITFVNTLGQRIRPEVYEKTVAISRAGREEIEAVVDYIAQEARQAGIVRAQKVWEEPVPASISLEEIAGGQYAFDGSGYSGHKNAGFAPVVGLIDAPDEQAQYPLVLDIGSEGHTVVYGGPRSGKTTFLQTFILSTAFLYTPDQVNIYIMDFGAWSMKALESLPHVGGVANGNDAERVSKLVGMLEKELEARKLAFSNEGVGNIDLYCEVSGNKLPYLALVIDNFDSVLTVYPELDEFFIKLAREGTGVGICMVMSSSSMSINFKVAQSIKQSLALQLVEASDYAAVVGKTDGQLPEKTPGRGLVRGKTFPHEFQTAQAIKCSSESERILKQRELCAAINNSWQGSKPAPIPVMPPVVEQRDLKCTADSVELGLRTQDITPLPVHYSSTWHMLVSGAPKSGKTNMLRLLANGLAQDTAAQLIIYEPDGTGRRFADLAGRARLITDPKDFDAAVGELIPVLSERKQAVDNGHPGSFSRIAILVDDFEKCFEAAAEQTIVRLRQIVKLSEGLAVNLYIAGDNAQLRRMEHLEELTMQLVGSGLAVALGESVDSHPSFRCTLSHSEKTAPMGPYEGYWFGPGAGGFKMALALEGGRHD